MLIKIYSLCIGFENLHNETISRNFAKCIGIWKIYITQLFREIIYTKFRINFAKCIDIWKIYITKQFREIIYTKFREIKITFCRYFVFREIKKNPISRPR
jgi:hypothetical protein